MTEEQRELISLLGQILFCGAPKQPVNQGVLQEAAEQAVLPTVASDDMIDIMNNMRVYQAHAALHRLLTEHQIPYVFLKGYASAYYYPNPTVRIAGDVDFLIGRDRIKEVRQILEASGFKEADEQDCTYDIVYEKNNLSYELHFQVNGVPEGNAGKVVESYLADTISTAIRIETPYGPMMIPDDFHHGLIILLHTARHMTHTGLGLRHVCDWAVFVNKQKDFTGLFEIPFRKMGLWDFACEMTALCCKWFSLPKQKWAGHWNEAFLSALLEDVLDAGNFGHKREVKNQERWLVANVDGGGAVERSPAMQLFHNINQVTKLHWPAARRYKLLLPVGFVFFSLRYILRMLTGKRKMINVRQMVNVAAERRGLYSEFHLFEMNK